ncbi:cupredoxin domain-containing protein [Compostimonas suwonensis]|uniref:Cupredoxin-like protein n=1 Tax=Compostimonas suwonensis TaxID=1048394 RepID=A0A2M9BVQ0_9MICO|nr:hypothetical protein [Compostimonas suwonensis]PJJ62029.1 hypothetical protein CLV54_1821 [Compostimonas suwonensis]
MGSRTLASAALAAVLLLGLTACSGGSAADEADGVSGSSAGAGASSADTGSDTGSDADSGANPGSDSDGEADAGAGAPGSAPVLVDTPPSPAATVGMTADGMDPGAVTVPAGSIVTFTSADDGFHAVIIDDMDGLTVAKGMPTSLRFDAPGSYVATDELGSGTATIEVD